MNALVTSQHWPRRTGWYPRRLWRSTRCPDLREIRPGHCGWVVAAGPCHLPAFSRAPDAGATLPLGSSHVVASVGTLLEGWERTVDHRTASHACKWSAVLLIVAGALAACGSAATSSPTTTAAALTGWRAPAVFSTPPDTGQIIEPLSANPTDLAAHGYVEQEYFASGTAYSFTSRSAPSDGKWTIAVSGSAPYRTRIIVRRPSDPAKFDGNVVVEWMNVSAGEAAPDWDYLDPALMDSGAAYVAVSAQALAVNGGKALLSSGSSPGLSQKEPARYGSLHHPGDQYSLDMFAQIGQALRTSAPSVLGGLRPSHVLAIGESQSAFYLTTYADAIQPLDHAYQGIFIHSPRRWCRPLQGDGRHLVDQRQCAHPHRPRRPRLHARDPDGPDPARLRGGTAAEHLQDPDVGSGRDIPR